MSGFGVGPDSPPRNEESRRGVKSSHEQGVVKKLRVARQCDQPDHGRARHYIGNRAETGEALFLLPLDHLLNNCQQKGQPHSCRNYHRENNPDDQETAELKEDAGEEGGNGAQFQRPPERIGIDSGKRHLYGSEPAISGLEGKNIEEGTEEVGDASQARRKEWHAGEDLGIPQGYFAICQSAPDMEFPYGIVEDQVAQKGVVRNGIGTQVAPRLELI